MRAYRTIYRLLATFWVLNTIFVVPYSFALPFNDDMVHDQFDTNEVMRALPAHSIPLGSLRYRVESKEEAEKLENPVEATAESLRRGKRSWRVNCAPCHGKYTDGKRELLIPVEAMPFTGPDVSIKAAYGPEMKSDGALYGVIHFGGLAVMPRYGYKLSSRESWDIVNYIRAVQGE